MFAAHALAYVANAWVVRLHPGIDHRFQRGHAVTTQGAIKAFEPVHWFALSAETHNTTFLPRIIRTVPLVKGYCIIPCKFFPYSPDAVLLIKEGSLPTVAIHQSNGGNSWICVPLRSVSDHDEYAEPQLKAP